MTSTTLNVSKIALIGDLLARAEGSDSAAERELALRRAEREAARHGIDLAEAAYANMLRGQPLEPEERCVVIGDSGTVGLRIFTDLFLEVSSVFDCENLISRSGSTVWVHGMPDDIDMVEAMYTSLLVQMQVSCEEWLATGEYRNIPADDLVWNERTMVWAPRRPHRGVARREFQRGFIPRIGAILRAEKQAVHDEATQAPHDLSDTNSGEANALTSTALALRAKSDAVEQFHRDICITRNVRGSYQGSWSERRDTAARQAGSDAARRADTGPRGARSITSG